MAEIVHGQCGHSLVGLLPGTTLSCSLTWGHTGRHSDGQSHWDSLDKAPLEDELKAARATIKSLTLVLEQAEKHVEDRDARIGDLAADKLELRAQLHEARQEVERLKELVGDEQQPGWDGCSRAEAVRQATEVHAQLIRWMDEHDARRAERDAARERVEALRRELERLRTIIRELGAGEAAEPPDGKSITPSLPPAYNPDGDQLLVIGNFVALTDEQINSLRSLLSLVHYDALAASWLDLLPPALWPMKTGPGLNSGGED